MKNKKLIIGIIGLLTAIIVTAIVITIYNLPTEEIDNRTDFEKLVSYIYESEEKIAGYKEINTMYDGEKEVYSKETNFTIERKNKVISEVSVKEKKLSTSGVTIYDESTTSYKTIDNLLITEVNGNKFETEYQMPTYYLTFVLSEEFLETGYSLVVNENNYKLEANVIDSKVSSLFLNKGIDITGVSIEITIEENKLKTFNASYKSTHGFDVVIQTSYYYGTASKPIAVFNLDGGTFKGSKYPVSYIYELGEHQLSTYIVDPNVLETEYAKQIVKAGYFIEGWYQTKIPNEDGTFTYEDKWDFAKDKMGKDGVILYPKWEENRIYTYELYYIDNDGNHVFLDKYQTTEGAKFYDRNLKVKEVEGYTVIGYLDEELSAWNPNYRHPGGDGDFAVKVYLDLIEGDYEIVTTANDFKSAINNNKNIYIANDIDFKNRSQKFTKTYSGTILGNNHTLSNIKVSYSATSLEVPVGTTSENKDALNIALFKNLENAVFKDITFDNIYVEMSTEFNAIKHVIIAPLALTAKNVIFENVSLNGSISYFENKDCENIIITDSFFYISENNQITEDSKVTVKEAVLPKKK